MLEVVMALADTEEAGIAVSGSKISKNLRVTDNLAILGSLIKRILSNENHILRPPRTAHGYNLHKRTNKHKLPEKKTMQRNYIVRALYKDAY